MRRSQRVIKLKEKLNTSNQGGSVGRMILVLGHCGWCSPRHMARARALAAAACARCTAPWLFSLFISWLVSNRPSWVPPPGPPSTNASTPAPHKILIMHFIKANRYGGNWLTAILETQLTSSNKWHMARSVRSGCLYGLFWIFCLWK